VARPDKGVCPSCLQLPTRSLEIFLPEVMRNQTVDARQSKKLTCATVETGAAWCRATIDGLRPDFLVRDQPDRRRRI